MIIVEKSAGGDSTGSILLLSERNEDNTGWLSHEDIKPDTVFHKMKSDDIATVRKRGYRTRMRILEKMKWVWVTGQTMVLRGRRRARIHGRRILTRQSNYEEQFLWPCVPRISYIFCYGACE